MADSNGDDPILELTIDRLAAGGEGVGRAPDGIAVFVPLSASGDRLRVRVVLRKRRFARAEIETILEPGPSRVTPRCSVFGRCGGCAWQHLGYPAQIEAKSSILADTMKRIGGLADVKAPIVMASPDAYGYRSRARVLERDGAVGFRQRRSDALCAVVACPVLAAPLEAALFDLNRHAVAEGTEREWEIAMGSDRTARVSEVGEQTHNGGVRDIVLEIGGDSIALSPGAFAQANTLLWQALHARVVSVAGEGERLLELYAGAGYFTLALARRFESVEAVESSRTSSADLRRNLAAAGHEGVRVIRSRVESVVPRHVADHPDVVVLDPPRRGLPEAVARGIAQLAPKRIVYLSCDPATLARDARRLVAEGYALKGLEGFDLFPQTPHIEALACFERDS